MGNAAIFLDRDDTIIEDPGYINDPEQVKVLPGVTDALSQLKKMGYKLVVVTNQSAVARGMVSEEVLEEIHERLRKLLGRKRVYLDHVYYCPYHPEAVIPKYRRDSDFRKPNPGMLFQAAEELGIDLKQSWMIGNSYSDIGAGVNAGCRTILIRSSSNPPVKRPGDPDPEKIAVNIKEAVNIIKMYRQQNMMTPRPSSPTAGAAPARTAEMPVKVANVSVIQPAGESAEAAVETEPEIAIEQQPAIISKPKPPVVKKRPRATARRSMTTERVEPQQHEPAAEAAPQPEAAPQEAVAAEPTPVPEPPVEATPPRRIHTAQAPSTASGRRFIEPHGGKPVATPPAARPSPADSSATQEVLNEVMRYLKKVDRLNMYDEFSWLKVLAGSLQVVVFFFLLLSVWFKLDPTREESSLHTVLLYAAVLQLMAIAFHLMRDRR